MATTTISRTAHAALVNDSGSGTDGTIVTKQTFADVFLDPFDVVLASDLELGGKLTLPNQPRCVAYNNATQTITTATITAVNLNAEDVDVFATATPMHDLVTNNNRITISFPGFYRVRAKVNFPANATGVRQIYLRKNGASVGFWSAPAASAGGQITAHANWEGDLAIGDFIDMAAYQDSGADMAIGSATRFTGNELSVSKLY